MATMEQFKKVYDLHKDKIRLSERIETISIERHKLSREIQRLKTERTHKETKINKIIKNELI